MEKKIVVIGMGYVGIPCAVLLADVEGFDVTGVQRRSERSGWKIECLNSGKNPFEGEEPGLSELISRVVKKGNFRVTDDISVCREADTILIDVQTPTDENRIPQYISLRQTSAGVGEHMKKGALVIIESTVAPGTTQNIVRPILEENSGLKVGNDFHLAFSYERVMPGKLIEYIVNMPRVVGGIDEKSTELAVGLYRRIVKAEITPTGCLTAELAKTVENAYRDVNIAFSNEMALVCENMGVDVFKLREIINSRHDRHMHLPGAGVGGHCLPKDTWLLRYGLSEYGLENTETDLIALARRVNDAMPVHMSRLVERALAEKAREVAGSRVAILGVSYLEDSDDTRNTPALPLIAALQSKEADLIAHDPYVKRFPELTIPLTDSLEQALKGADCAAIVTKHKPYYEIDLKWARKLMHTPVIVDGRNVLSADKVRAAGFLYRGIGKG
ncbi:MAG: nucleotide sugar dehydrogenase [Deltaproteobacteria bacterium]|nr:MAG: nucleotide sugar dehydrogenase [Deltaproteobacteria bacterium]